MHPVYILSRTLYLVSILQSKLVTVCEDGSFVAWTVKASQSEEVSSPENDETFNDSDVYPGDKICLVIEAISFLFMMLIFRLSFAIVSC